MKDFETMSMEELEGVSGGNYVEMEKDLKLFKALGRYSGTVPNIINSTNFAEYSAILTDLWKGTGDGVTFDPQEGKLNGYKIDGNNPGKYANNRKSAISYAIANSGRILNPKNYL